MHLIGINGFKRSGKDTTAKIVQAIYGDGSQRVLRVAFADKLKLIAAKALGFEGTDAELIALMDIYKESGVLMASARSAARADDPRAAYITGRAYLQHMGNHARQVFGDNFWIDQVLPTPVEHTPGMDRLDRRLGNERRLSAMYPGIDCIVITDARYANEAERITTLGGVMWEVVRPECQSDGHASEQALPRWLVNHVIVNDGDLLDLEFKVEAALDTLSC